MKSGARRYFVTVEQQVEQQSTDGGVVEAWEPVFSEWASIEPLRGREFFQAAQTQSEIDTKIRMSFRDGVTASMRITHNGTHYDIQSVIDVGGRRRNLEIMAKAYV